MAVLDGHRLVLGARHLAGMREDLPAHRPHRAARGASDPPDPAARAALPDPAVATGRRRRAELTPEPVRRPRLAVRAPLSLRLWPARGPAPPNVSAARCPGSGPASRAGRRDR